MSKEHGKSRHHRARAGAIAVAVAALAAGGVAATQANAAPRTPAAASSTDHGTLSVTKVKFGTTVEPYTGQNTQVYRYTLTNDRRMSVSILSYGGIIQSIELPGRNGAEADVVLGFKTLADYVAEASPPVTANGGPYFGETIGRYGNRIAKGTFSLNQPGVGKVTYTLPINNGANDLHGGLVGFGDHVWSQAGLIHSSSEVGVTLQLVSPNGDSSGAAGSPGCPTGCTGFPAKITVDVTFTLNNNDQLGIHYKAVNDSSNLNTVINLTNHSYFNLAGQGSAAGSAYGQYIQLNANKYTPTDTTQIPLGYNVAVAGTPFDFRAPHTIGSRISDVSAPDHAPAADNQLLIAQGYDHNWVLNPKTHATTGPDGLNLAARASDVSSGRRLTVWTDQPGVQFYSGNFLTGTLVGITGDTYRQGAGYTFETQHFPNSPNQSNFPSTELAAGATMTTTTIFAFSSNGI
ncbi:MAG TPA: aldose epimerase family protein [Trebonia sp.]|nr:aldose epimerase family protein [Trebonia sp.]